MTVSTIPGVCVRGDRHRGARKGAEEPSAALLKALDLTRGCATDTRPQSKPSSAAASPPVLLHREVVPAASGGVGVQPREAMTPTGLPFRLP